MKAQILIEKIHSACNMKDVGISFKDAVKVVHPDVCSHPSANDAFIKLKDLHKGVVVGKTYTDDSGQFISNGKVAVFKDNPELLKLSYENYKVLKLFKHSHFNKYLPESMEYKNETLTVTFKDSSIPLTDLELPQEHVNWILSRILEFVCWMPQIKYIHSGINPSSVFVVPETHGIIITSFYHMVKNTKLKTVSAKYRNWYPNAVFSKMYENFKAGSIDLELAKKTAIYLLGDKSGSGNKLIRTHNKEFVRFVTKQNSHAGNTYNEYRNLLESNFEKKFHNLNL